eukprot:TRINITY_DN1924_c1_g1_i1.p1 TRINITY_DN1924_c1_g1~~TRINITY_DN1924_c1_g1_i1.p1  ORF type:complete len:512 (+),score=73.13 TRINITY_DN1924_c1_g1_i1:51-1586(+)
MWKNTQFSGRRIPAPVPEEVPGKAVTLREESTQTAEQPTIEGITQQAERHRREDSTPTVEWTNTDVVHWLLKIDQKAFIPAAITNNINGITLMTLKKKDLPDAFVNFSKAGVANLSVESLWYDIQTLSKTTSSDHHIALTNGVEELEEHEDGEQYSAVWFKYIDEMEIPENPHQGDLYYTKEKECDGHLKKSSTGWSYEREYREWVDYFEIYCENALVRHLGADLKKTMEKYQLVTLILSSLATLASSSALVFQGGEEEEEEKLATSERRLASHQQEDWFENVDWALVIQIFVLILSFLTTTVSGYVQIFDKQWKEQLRQSAKYQDVAGRLMTVYDDNLTVPLEDRKQYSEYRTEVQKLSSELPMLNDFTPWQRSAALRSIKATDPTTWRKGFDLQAEVLGGCIDHCSPQNIVLTRPIGRQYEYMLMRFSGEELCYYVLQGHAFREFKHAAKDWLRGQVKTIKKRDLWCALGEDADVHLKDDDDESAGEHSQLLKAKPPRSGSTTPSSTTR